jgi:exonuclease III
MLEHQGLNAKSKQSTLMNAINISGCSVICLQETKKEDFHMAFIKSCCPSRFHEYVFIPSTGSSGGLIIIWNSSVFSGMVMHCEPFAISVHFTSK